MLDKDEELRVAAIQNSLNHEIKEGGIFSAYIRINTIKWLVDKLKETNDELGKTAEELQMAHQENGQLRRALE